jgi:hypothetical protein
VSEPAPSRIIRQDRRDLREREHEDEVEEKLKRSDALLALGVLLAHSRTLARTDRDREFAHLGQDMRALASPGERSSSASWSLRRPGSGGARSTGGARGRGSATRIPHTAHGRDPRLHGRGCGARAPAGRVPARGAIRRIGLRQLRPSSCLIETTLRGAHLQLPQMEQPQCLQNRGRESAVTFKACGKGRHFRRAGDFGTTHDYDAAGARRGREVLKRRERP